MSCHLIVNNIAAGHDTTCVWSHECDMKCKVELTAPLKCTGDISARYMGAKPAFNPELIPMKNRPMMIISKEPAAFEAPAKKLHDLNWPNHEQALWVLQRLRTVYLQIWQQVQPAHCSARGHPSYQTALPQYQWWHLLSYPLHRRWLQQWTRWWSLWTGPQLGLSCCALSL